MIGESFGQLLAVDYLNRQVTNFFYAFSLQQQFTKIVFKTKNASLQPRATLVTFTRSCSLIKERKFDFNHQLVINASIIGWLKKNNRIHYSEFKMRFS